GELEIIGIQTRVLTDFEGSANEISAVTTIRNIKQDKRRASYDVTHVFNLNAIYELPFGRGQAFLSNAPGYVSRIIGGWNASTIVRISSVGPVSILSQLQTFNQRTTNSVTLSPDLSVDQVQQYLGIFRTPYGVMFVDPKAPFMKITLDSAGKLLTSQVDLTKLQSPTAGKLGTLATGAFRTPLIWNADIAFTKRTQIRESVNLELRAELFNAFNHPNFSFPSLVTSSTQFGVITFAGSRSIQVSARVNF
ncbi:MAG: hypothetical protein ABI882_12370, partial [Acidobacteriota bacterium]